MSQNVHGKPRDPRLITIIKKFRVICTIFSWRSFFTQKNCIRELYRYYFYLFQLFFLIFKNIYRFMCKRNIANAIFCFRFSDTPFPVTMSIFHCSSNMQNFVLEIDIWPSQSYQFSYSKSGLQDKSILIIITTIFNCF